MEGVHYSKNNEGKKLWLDRPTSKQCSDAMSEDLIAKHNSLVKAGDTVYHLGDYAFGGKDKVAGYLRRMNGNFKFIFGNHDEGLTELSKVISQYPDLRDRIEFLGDYAVITVETQRIVLMHYAMRTWDRSHADTWQLYGHSHGQLKDDPGSMNIDVGVDCHNYYPITFEQVRDIMSKKTWKPLRPMWLRKTAHAPKL